LLPLLGYTYNLAYSPEGSQMIYSLTYGLGYGSQTWIANADGQNARLALEDPQSIIAFARWSPRGDRPAYIRMDDNNIPFTVGELWLADSNGNNAVLAGQADAGHGYEPAWSPDGAIVAFVGRENGEDTWTDQDADRLASNIYMAAVDKGLIHLRYLP
jgi:Tol biopolymer transport system component